MYCSKYAHVVVFSDWVVAYNAFIGGTVALSNDLLPYITISGNRLIAVDEKMPSKVVELLKNKHILSENPELDVNDEQERQTIIEKAATGELIQSLRLTLTKACNCECSYCYVEKSEKMRPLDFNDCRVFLDNIISNTNRSDYSVRFFGGEPTLEFETIIEVVNYLDTQYPHIRFDYLLNTNAQNITPKMISFLREKRFKTVISLDSVKANNDLQRVSKVHKSYYDEAIKQIKLFAESKMTFVVGAVVTNQNFRSLPEFVLKMRDIGVKNVGLNHAKMVSSNIVTLDKEFADAIINSYIFGIKNNMNISGYWYLPYKRMLYGTHAGFCGGLGYELDLRPDRKIYSCVANSVPIGALDAISDIFKSKQYNDIVSRVPPYIELCRGCELEGLCAGECACDARYVSREFNSINPAICSFQKYITYTLLKLTFSQKI